MPVQHHSQDVQCADADTLTSILTYLGLSHDACGTCSCIRFYTTLPRDSPVRLWPQGSALMSFFHYFFIKVFETGSHAPQAS